MEMTGLEAVSPLGGVRVDIGGVTIEEVTDRAIVSVATPLGGEAVLAEAMRAAYGAAMPAPGSTTRRGEVLCVGLARDQAFLLFPWPSPSPERLVAEALGDTAYLTDQSDGWAILRVSGPATRDALARICSLDLHPSVFPEGKVARTMMEHLGVIILAEGEDSFLLMSARSSAASFLHAVEVSARNIT